METKSVYMETKSVYIETKVYIVVYNVRMHRDSPIKNGNIEAVATSWYEITLSLMAIHTAPSMLGMADFGTKKKKFGPFFRALVKRSLTVIRSKGHTFYTIRCYSGTNCYHKTEKLIQNAQEVAKKIKGFAKDVQDFSCFPLFIIRLL